MLYSTKSGYGRVELPQGDRQSPVLTDILIAHKSKAECFKMIGYSTHYHFYRTLNYAGLSVWIITPSILKENTQPIHIQHPTETLILSVHIL